MTRPKDLPIGWKKYKFSDFKSGAEILLQYQYEPSYFETYNEDPKNPNKIWINKGTKDEVSCRRLPVLKGKKINYKMEVPFQPGFEKKVKIIRCKYMGDNKLCEIDKDHYFLAYRDGTYSRIFVKMPIANNQYDDLYTKEELLDMIFQEGK